jgi:hypothetical protein
MASSRRGSLVQGPSLPTWKALAAMAPHAPGRPPSRGREDFNQDRSHVAHALISNRGMQEGASELEGGRGPRALCHIAVSRTRRGDTSSTCRRVRLGAACLPDACGVARSLRRIDSLPEKDGIGSEEGPGRRCALVRGGRRRSGQGEPGAEDHRLPRLRAGLRRTAGRPSARRCLPRVWPHGQRRLPGDCEPLRLLVNYVDLRLTTSARSASHLAVDRAGGAGAEVDGRTLLPVDGDGCDRRNPPPAAGARDSGAGPPDGRSLANVR